MRPACLISLGVLAAGVWWALGSGPALDGAGVPRFALLYFSAAILYLLAALLVRLKDAPPSGGQAPEAACTRRLLWIVLVGALAFRACMLGATPSLSDDCYRYVWEGRVQLAGFNPYTHAPQDPALEPLRGDGYAKVNHPEIPGIYGPLLEVCFALLGLIGGVSAFKLAFVLVDLALSLLVLRSLSRARASPLWLLVYAWHPLLVLEVAGQGHLEVVAVALLALAVDLEHRGRTRLAPLALGCAIAAKYLPLLVVPAFVLSVRGGRARVTRLGLIALPGLLLLLPYLLAGGGPERALGAYGSTWRFNDGGFFVVDASLRGLGLSQAFCRSILPAFVDVPQGFDPAAHQTWMLVLPKVAVGLAATLVMAWASWPRDGEVDVERAAFTAGALFLALSPTVHPWYALWLLPFLPARAARGRTSTAAWLTLTLALPVAYAVKVGPWREIPWTRPLVYLPVAALLAASLLREIATARARRPG